MEIHSGPPEQEESKDKDEDGFHMAENLEWNGSESTDADELTEVCSNGNGAWQ